MTTDVEQGTIRPADLRQWAGGPLYVKNMSRTTISFDDAKGTVVTIPQRDKEDSIQVLPLAMAQDPGFQKMWRRGQVMVSTDPAIEEELTLAEQRAELQRERDREDIFSKVEEPASDKDLMQASCLHCQKICFVKAKEYQENSIPTLCEDHKDLAAMFVPEITIDPVSGLESTKWVAATVAPTKRSPVQKK